jgi:hypothetical protein
VACASARLRVCCALARWGDPRARRRMIAHRPVGGGSARDLRAETSSARPCAQLTGLVPPPTALTLDHPPPAGERPPPSTEHPAPSTQRPSPSQSHLATMPKHGHSALSLLRSGQPTKTLRRSERSSIRAVGGGTRPVSCAHDQPSSPPRAGHRPSHRPQAGHAITRPHARAPPDSAASCIRIADLQEQPCIRP